MKKKQQTLSQIFALVATDKKRSKEKKDQDISKTPIDQKTK